VSTVTCDMAMSVDGYTAGPGQRLDAPFGDGPVDRLTRWMIEAREDNAAEIAGILGAGAYIMGRNMFGPDRGEWDLSWTGWWGEEPPYQAPVFVLAHRPRPPVALRGTTFTFVPGVAEAMALARDAAGGRDVSVAGGAATVNQFLAAGLIDELRLHVAPVLLGRGERLFVGVPGSDLVPVSARQTPLVTHLTYRLPR
jgi:dihydrofolate reductase